jgi:OHCU decarboxylase
VDLSDLNRLPAVEAREAFASCCASSAWAAEMTARRPYGDLASLLADAERVWWDLTPDDWLEAFASHPLIGQPPRADDAHSRWSRREQAAAEDAGTDTRHALAECNRAYEERFGFTFIVFASGRTAEEILEMCRARLGNGEVHELTVAAAEQARITNLRLRRLVETA